MRSLDFKRRDVMLGFNIFQPALGGRNLSLQFLRLFGFNALLAEFRGIAFNVPLQRARLAMKCGNSVYQTLPDSFLQMKLTYLLDNLQPRTRNFPPQSS